VIADLLRQKDVFVLRKSFLNRIIEIRIADAGTVEAGKEITDETKKQRDIIIDELWKIHITKRSHQHNVLQTQQIISSTLLCKTFKGTSISN